MEKMTEVRGLKSWQWIFFLDNVPNAVQCQNIEEN